MTVGGKSFKYTQSERRHSSASTAFTGCEPRVGRLRLTGLVRVVRTCSVSGAVNHRVNWRKNRYTYAKRAVYDLRRPESNDRRTSKGPRYFHCATSGCRFE